MEDFVKCFGEVGVDYINLMMTDERLDANVAKLVVVDLPGIKPCWLGLMIRPARKVS